MLRMNEKINGMKKRRGWGINKFSGMIFGQQENHEKIHNNHSNISEIRTRDCNRFSPLSFMSVTQFWGLRSSCRVKKTQNPGILVRKYRSKSP